MFVENIILFFFFKQHLFDNVLKYLLSIFINFMHLLYYFTDQFDLYYTSTYLHQSDCSVFGL